MHPPTPGIMDSEDRKTTGSETLRQVGAGAAGCLMAGSGTCGGVSVLAGLFNDDQAGRFFEIVWGGLLLVVFAILYLTREKPE
jgi:hypothetical protein